MESFPSQKKYNKREKKKKEKNTSCLIGFVYFKCDEKLVSNLEWPYVLSQNNVLCQNINIKRQFHKQKKSKLF